MTRKPLSNKADIRGYIKANSRQGEDRKEIFKELCDVNGNTRNQDKFIRRSAK